LLTDEIKLGFEPNPNGPGVFSVRLSEIQTSDALSMEVNMYSFHISKKISAILGLIVVLVAAGSAIAQDSPRDEFEEWQKAKREAAREHREYLNNPRKGNYLDWRSAQRDANREYDEYLLALEVSRRYSKGSRTWMVAESDVRDEYDEWKAAQRELAREHAEYVSHPTRDNYEGWMDAKEDVRREYAEYRAAVNANKPVSTRRVKKVVYYYE
jgi:hypothetical protein